MAAIIALAIAAQMAEEDRNRLQAESEAQKKPITNTDTNIDLPHPLSPGTAIRDREPAKR